MNSRFFLLALCLTFALASFASVRAATDGVIPPVPENGTPKDYLKYIYTVNDLLNQKVRDIEFQAYKDGIDKKSEAFTKLLKNSAKEYLIPIEKATDKALLLKDVPDEDFDKLVESKVENIEMTVWLNDDEDAGDAQMEAFVKQLRKMNKSKAADGVEFLLLRAHIEKLKSELQTKFQAGLNEGKTYSILIKELAGDFSPIEQAIDRALLLKGISDDDYKELIEDKSIFIMSSAEINGDKEDAVIAKMKAFAEQLRKIDKSKFADLIEAKIFRIKVSSYVHKGNIEAFAKAAAEIDDEIEKAGKSITPAQADKAFLIGVMSVDQPGYKAPEGRIKKYIKALSEADDPEVKSYANSLESVIEQMKDDK